MRRVAIGYFERDALIEELAREFYRIRGYQLLPEARMQDQFCPRARQCVASAIVAIDRLTTDAK